MLIFERKVKGKNCFGFIMDYLPFERIDLCQNCLMLEYSLIGSTSLMVKIVLKKAHIGLLSFIQTDLSTSYFV